MVHLGIHHHYPPSAVSVRLLCQLLARQITRTFQDTTLRGSQGRATGVVTADGMLHRSVVSNADPRRTFAELVGAEHLPADFAAKIAALTPSTSALVVFLGIDFVPDVEPITIISGRRREPRGPRTAGSCDVEPPGLGLRRTPAGRMR